MQLKDIILDSGFIICSIMAAPHSELIKIAITFCLEEKKTIKKSYKNLQFTYYRNYFHQLSDYYCVKSNHIQANIDKPEFKI